MPFYERQPYIQPLHQLVTEVLAGEVRVPLFQRPGTSITWRAEQRGDLLDSVYRGFPIGMILLWSTQIEVGSLDEVGGFRIPPRTKGQTQRLLLDGHQRLSTFVSILGRSLLRSADSEVPAPRDDEETWVFDLSDDAPRSRDRFVLLKPGQQPTATQLPFEDVLDRTTLNAWIRERTNLTTDQVRLADGLRDRFREYNVPVAVLAQNDLSEATESFKRINSSGTPMGPFHMVAARAFDGTFNLQEVVGSAVEEHLEPLGWGSLDESDLLRICVGLDGATNPLKLDIEAAAQRFRSDPTLVPRAVAGATWAARVLARIGVHGPNALPYGYQFISFAILFGRVLPATSLDPAREEDLEALLSQDDSEALERWFWLTTYGEVFAGVNSAVYQRAYTALESMTEGGNHSALTRDLTRTVREPVRFDYRTARATACALAMARVEDEGDRGGPAHWALATKGVDALETLFGRRSNWWSRVIVTDGELDQTALRSSLRQAAQGKASDEDWHRLGRVGIPKGTDGGLDELLAARRAFLLSEERRFVEALPDLSWGA